MAILAKSGRVVIAESVAVRPLHLAWGLGDGAWTTPPAENNNATALLSEVGRRTIDTVQFVVHDEAGSIILPNGRFSVSATPTNNLLVSVQFDLLDASSSVIREYALFAGTETVAGLPVGQRYFIPSEILSPGRLLHVGNIQPIYRSTAIREGFRVVITF